MIEKLVVEPRSIEESDGLEGWSKDACAPLEDRAAYIGDSYMKPQLRLDGVGGGVPGDSGFAEIGFVGHVAG
jgi:hypothetical protein